jgi:hypothetical protein
VSLNEAEYDIAAFVRGIKVGLTDASTGGGIYTRNAASRTGLC